MRIDLKYSSLKKHTVLLILIMLFIQDLAYGYQWIPRANFGGVARHRCTAFSVGNKGYIGGGHINSGTPVYHEDYWEYDPVTDSWTQIADFGGGKRYHATAFSIGEFGYVGCGEDDDDNYHTDFYRYSPQFNVWQPIASMPGNPRRGATSFVINELGYVGTGQSDFGYEDDFYKYDPNANAWYSVADFMGEARSSAVGFSYNGKGYVGTGHIFGDHTKDFYEYDPISNSWSQKADVGTTYRQDATGFVVNGKAYIGTGNDVDGNLNYKDFWEYDFNTNTWTQISDFDAEGRRYMVSFVIDGIAYAGTGTDGTNLRDFYRFDITASDETDWYKMEITPYPNPSIDKIIFDFHGLELQLQLFSVNGELIMEKMASDKIEVNKADTGSGTFVYLLKFKNGTVRSGKITLC